MRCWPALAMGWSLRRPQNPGVRDVDAPRFLYLGKFIASCRNAPPSAMTSGVSLGLRLRGARASRRAAGGSWKFACVSREACRVMLVTDAVGQGKVPKEHDAKGLAARLLARRTRKMSTDYSPLKKVSAFSLFDGCL